MEDQVLQGLNFFSKNPRYITSEAKEKLIKLTAELGDISGIVIDINSKQFIGGNQRSDILDLKGHIENVEWVIEYEAATEQGTLKVGFFTDPRTEERFNVRLVDWTPEQCDIANLAANYAGGTSDLDKLLRSFSSENVLKVFDLEKLKSLPDTIDTQLLLGEFIQTHFPQQEEGVLPPSLSDSFDDFFNEADSSSSEKPNSQSIVLTYSFEDYEKVKQKFQEIGGSKEQIVFNLLGLSI